MKMFKRVLAMLLTIFTLLAVLPVSAFADAWLDADANTTQTGNVTGTDVTLTFDAKALLQYLKDKDLSGLLKGMDASGLKDIISKEELLEIIPTAQVKELINAIVEDVDPQLIMQYVDIQALLADVDKAALVDLIKEVDNLEDYIIDFGALEDYVFDTDDDQALADLVGFIDTDALLNDYAKELMELALELPADDLADIVDVNAAVHLPGVDFAAAVNKAYFENVITYAVLVDKYVDDDKLHDFIEANYDRFVHELPDFVHDDVLVGILEGRVSDLEAYVNKDALRALVEAKNASGAISYATLKDKGIIDPDALTALIENGTYADIADYVNTDHAQKLMIDNIDPLDLVDFWVGGIIDGEVDVQAVFNSNMLKQKYDISNLMMNGDGVTPAAVDVEGLVFDTDSAYSIKVLMEENVINTTAMFVGANRLFTVGELEAAGALDYDVLLFGDEDTDPLFGEDQMGSLLEQGVFDTNEMLNGTAHHPNPLFSLNELIAWDVIKLNDLTRDGHKYDDMADIAKLEKQLFDLIEAGALNAQTQVLPCIKKDASGKPDYATALKTIGPDKAVQATCGYNKLLTDYVSDMDGLLTAIGIEAIIEDVIADDKLNTIFDVDGLIEAIGMNKLIALVDVQKVITEFYQSGGLFALLKSLNYRKYAGQLLSIVTTLESNIQAITINGVTVTEKPISSVLVINTDNLFKALQDTIPTLNDLANLGDDGVLLSFSVALTYKSEATNNVAKTKSINAKFAVAEGAGLIRRAAGKLQTIMNKFVSVRMDGGVLVTDFYLPSEFATVFKKALQTLGYNASPEALAIRDAILGAYDDSLSDMTNLIEKVTLGQVVEALDKIDSKHFNAAYNTVIGNKYVEIVLNYIEKAADVDLSGITLDDIIGKGDEALDKIDDLANKAYRLPTPAEIINKVESLIGKDISSKLPDRVEGVLNKEIADIFFTLSDKVGNKFNFDEILKNAASTEDPVQALYDAVLDKISDFEDAFEAIKSRTLGVAKKFLSTSVGQKLNSLRLSGFYEGNGVFGFKKTNTVTPNIWIELAVEKVVNFAFSKVEFAKEDEAKEMIDTAVDYVLGYFTDATITFGLDASLRVTGLYKAVFYDETGKNVILSTFLPVGADLSLMLDAYVPAKDGDVFVGWKDISNGKILSKMPGKDVAFIADVKAEGEEPGEETMYDVIVVDPEDALKIVYFAEVAEGTPLKDLEADMKAKVEEYRGALAENEILTWILNGNSYVIKDQTVQEDMTFTWKITTQSDPGEDDVYYTVTVVDRVTQLPIGDPISVKKGDTLNSHKEELDALLTAHIGEIPEDKTVEWQNLDGTAYDLDAKILENVTITWVLKDKEPDNPPEEDTYYTVTVYNRINGVLANEGTEYSVLEGTKFGTAVSGWNETVIAAYPELTEHEEFVYVYTHTWLNANKKALDMSAKITSDVTIIADIHLDFANAGIMIEGFDAGEHFKVYRDGYYYVLEWIDEGGWLDAGMDVRLSDAFIEKWVAHDAKNGFKMIATNSKHSIVVENAILDKLGEAAETYAKVDFDAHDVTENWGFVADSGASYFTFDFIVDDDVIDLGAFDGGVVITMPFVGAANSATVKTFLYVDGEAEALEITKYGAGYITFAAPHFSEFALVNKYYIGIADDYGWDNALGTKPALGAAIATAPFESGYYEYGYELTVGKLELTDDAKNAGLEYVRTEIVGGTVLEEGDTYVVTGAAEYMHYATTRTYYIYFYVGGELKNTVDYTKFTTLPTYEQIVELAGEGNFWYGVTAESFANDLCKKDMFLFLISDVADTTITVNFKDRDGNVLLTYTKTTAQWYDEFAYLASNVAAALSELSTNRVTVWKDANGKALSEYTLADLLSAATIDFVAAEYSDRAYTIFTDGNVSVVGSAKAGDLVTVTVNQKVGMNATVVIVDATGASVALTDGKFVMPASDVTISVTYAPIILSYWNINGEKVDVPYGTSISYTVTIPKDYFVDVTALTAKDGALAGWTLISSSTNEAGDLVLTYSMVLTASDPAINLKAIDTGLTQLKYQDIYVVDGKYYYSKADAEDALPEGVSAEWRQGAYKNLYFASLQYTADDSAVGLIVLCILLGLLVLILIIALLYTLYICGKLKPNWFLKGITAIVSAFFAVCMAVAAAGLWIAKLFGYKEEDLMEELDEVALPEIQDADTQEVVESIEEQAEADVIDEVIVADETEAVAEEVTTEEAPVVESVEETAEADVVEAAEADDAIEVTVEEAVEETIEEVVEEAVEETAPEAEAEEAVEEVAPEAEAEEAVEEVAPEAEAEEAVEEVAPEAEAEEAVEEVAPEAEAEEVVEEVAPEAEAEEAVEEVAPEAEAEEAVEEVAPEAEAEEAVEEVALEAEAEEVVEEVAPEAEAEEAVEEVAPEAEAEEAVEEVAPEAETEEETKKENE